MVTHPLSHAPCVSAPHVHNVVQSWQRWCPSAEPACTQSFGCTLKPWWRSSAASCAWCAACRFGFHIANLAALTAVQTSCRMRWSCLCSKLRTPNPSISCPCQNFSLTFLSAKLLPVTQDYLIFCATTVQRCEQKKTPLQAWKA